MSNRLTIKQIDIIRVVTTGNGADPTGKFIPVDLDELLARLSYKTTKASIQFSIRALIDHKYLEKGPQEQRRGRIRVVFLATELGKSVVTDLSKPAELPKEEDLKKITGIPMPDLPSASAVSFPAEIADLLEEKEPLSVTASFLDDLLQESNS